MERLWELALGMIFRAWPRQKGLSNATSLDMLEEDRTV